MPEAFNNDPSNFLYSNEFLLHNDHGYDSKFHNDIMQIESIQIMYADEEQKSVEEIEDQSIIAKSFTLKD